MESVGEKEDDRRLSPSHDWQPFLPLAPTRHSSILCTYLRYLVFPSFHPGLKNCPR